MFSLLTNSDCEKLQIKELREKATELNQLYQTNIKGRSKKNFLIKFNKYKINFLLRIIKIMIYLIQQIQNKKKK